VSSELGITNGHAARMRYSRFKQQMEGNTPVRRARNPNAKRAPKQKRPKDDDKNSQKVKLEDSPSMGEHMPSSSPSVANFDSQGSLTPVMAESAIVKSEPREDPSSPETTLALPTTNYTSPSMSMQSMNLPDQTHQPGSVLTVSSSCEAVPQFTYDATHPQIQHQQSMFQPMMPQVHAMMGQNLNEEISLGMTEQRDYGFMGMDMYNPMNDVGCHGHMMVPMVKVEERWDSSYGQS
jgi:hypothetical protein